MVSFGHNNIYRLNSHYTYNAASLLILYHNIIFNPMVQHSSLYKGVVT